MDNSHMNVFQFLLDLNGNHIYIHIIYFPTYAFLNLPDLQCKILLYFTVISSGIPVSFLLRSR